jgi:hypothetical protein
MTSTAATVDDRAVEAFAGRLEDQADPARPL